MKQAEFLNLETKKVQWLDASLEHPNLVKVPEGAKYATLNSQCYFWKDGNDYSWSRLDGIWNDNKGETMDDYISRCIGVELINLVNPKTPLRQRIDETKQKLGMNERQLSKAIGREESYITKMFSSKRSPKPSTVEKLIGDLDCLMGVKETEDSHEDEFNEFVQLEILRAENKGLKGEVALLKTLLNQANQNTESYRNQHANLKDCSRNFVIVSVLWIAIVLFFCLWG